eukprot:TRINITY_DN12090_c0_g1_i1.p1 TRINITY_DN12090_c0_g1~~TRINITY_DN12090_c0_g1_i1.p1  ORF type:complete len:321 (-),score=97.07 TRINITY_DN12090_c0_g1_i1:34-996(-)
MSGKGLKGRAKKAAYIERVVDLFENHSTIFIVHCDNIGSSHMQRIRASIRGSATILMGKNSLLRKAITDNLDENPEWEAILPCLKGNVGLVFATPGVEITVIKDLLLATRVPAAAKVGAIAPNSVTVPAGMTGLEPTKTSFLQALNIPSKISRGQIEILNPWPLITEGDRVGASEAALLQMLNIRPFSYGLIILSYYENGSVFDAAILDITKTVILSRFAVGLSNVAALSLETGLPTIAAFPHAVLNGYKNLLAVVLETDYLFPQAELVKQMVDNPDAFVSEAPAKEDEAEAEPEAVVESSSDSSSGDFGGGMFGDSSSY